jgi:hypothetical protein
MRKLQRPVIRTLGCLHSKSTAPQAQHVPSPCSLVVFPGTWQENLVHTTCHSRRRRSVDGRAQRTRRMLVQLCKHVKNQLQSSLPACRDNKCTEPRIEACITCTCTNFGPQIQLVRPQYLGHAGKGAHVREQRAVVCRSRLSILLPPNCCMAIAAVRGG